MLCRLPAGRQDMELADAASIIRMTWGARLLTLSSSSWMATSVCFSSSVGFAGMLVAEENCEYLWK